MQQDVLVVWPNRPKQMEILENTYTLHHLYKAGDGEALLERIAPNIRAIATTGEKGASRELIERLPNLEIISCYGVGTDAIDHEACAQRGIPVTNTPDVLTEDVADMGLVLLLAVLRRIPMGDRWVREGRWQREGTMPLTTTPHGKTLGILGLGRIGKALARRAAVINMNVIYHGRHAQPDVAYRFYDTLTDMARACDLLAICAPGGAATRGMVDEPVLEALGSDSYLVNIGRGSIVDEPGLVRAIRDGKIAGAALDVFADEPNVPPELIGRDNVVLQPHAASATNETRHAMAQLVVDNLAAHFAGEPLLTPVK